MGKNRKGAYKIMKKFMTEFKEFIARGDVMSMAVGIIIGGAFTAIVNSLVGDIITPLIGMITGGIDFTGLCISVDDAKIMVGNFIQAVIVFLITAFVIFSMMKAFNRLLSSKDKDEEKAASEAEAAPEPDINEQTLEVLKEIRELLSKK